MIQVIASHQRHQVEAGWLSSRWHFSFGDYHDPANERFSALRVFNDDTVQPGGTFDMHPHRDMEIVSYVLDGNLEHRDHLGHRGVVGPGDVQAMSAGRGILHSERNPSDTAPVHFLQIWLLPRQRGATPRYAQRHFEPADRKDKLLPIVVSDERKVDGQLAIDQDATIYVASLSAGKRLSHRAAGQPAYIFVMAGAIRVNGVALSAGDQARVTDEAELMLEATEPAELMLIDLP